MHEELGFALLFEEFRKACDFGAITSESFKAQRYAIDVQAPVRRCLRRALLWPNRSSCAHMAATTIIVRRSDGGACSPRSRR